MWLEDGSFASEHWLIENREVSPAASLAGFDRPLTLMHAV
jgi:hypothetical protein